MAHPGRVRHQLPHRDFVPGRTGGGQVPADRVVQIEGAAIDEDQRARRHELLADRGHLRLRVHRPGTPGRVVGQTGFLLVPPAPGRLTRQAPENPAPLTPAPYGLQRPANSATTGASASAALAPTTK